MMRTMSGANPARAPSRGGSAGREAGFTLIEAIAVMLIIALVASLAVTMMTGTGRAGLGALTREPAARVRGGLRGAILTGPDRQVSLDGERRTLIGDGGDAVALPP